MIYAYVRVSTGKQNLENQQLEIEAFCKSNGIAIGRWVQEKTSGTKHGCFMLSAPQIGREVKFSHNPRVRFGKKSSFPTIRASDWTKHGCFMLSAPQIQRKAEFFRFPRVRLGEKSSFPTIRAPDWAKS